MTSRSTRAHVLAAFVATLSCILLASRAFATTPSTGTIPPPFALPVSLSTPTACCSDRSTRIPPAN